MICLGLGTAAALTSTGGGDPWYKELIKPPGTPPPWLFGPVWSVLYLLMGCALGRLIHRRAKSAIGVFIMQFGLNLIWTPIFFEMQQIPAALAVIVAIWLGVAATISLARQVDRISAYLLIPYILWVSYATYLNAGLFWLNR